MKNTSKTILKLIARDKTTLKETQTLGERSNKLSKVIQKIF